jgi:translation elongation factor P/translation initiation factor 5A
MSSEQKTSSALDIEAGTTADVELIEAAHTTPQFAPLPDMNDPEVCKKVRRFSRPADATKINRGKPIVLKGRPCKVKKIKKSKKGPNGEQTATFMGVDIFTGQPLEEEFDLKKDEMTARTPNVANCIYTLLEVTEGDGIVLMDDDYVQRNDLKVSLSICIHPLTNGGSRFLNRRPFLPASEFPG